MTKEETFEKLRDAVLNGDEAAAKNTAEEIVKSGKHPLDVIANYLTPAMRLVGQKFEKGEYFLTNLMLSGEAMKSATGILTAGLSKDAKGRLKGQKAGIIVLGTVAGDVHDIGKNILGLLLEANSFEVHDLGRDVPSMRFIEKAEETSAHIIALSSLMTTTRPAQKDVIELLKGMGIKKKYVVIVGGAPTSDEWAKEIGADGWAETAEEAVGLAQKIAKGIKR